MTASHRTCPERADISVYFAAGINVCRKADMFRDAMAETERRCLAAGPVRIRTNAFYPYGCIDDVPERKLGRFVARQAFAVFADMCRRAAAGCGGTALYRDVRADYDVAGGGNLFLVGHSGGGIAAYKAAQLLIRDGYPVGGVFMVGSPKVPVRKNYRDLVFAVEIGRRWADPITRCGFHGFRPPRLRARLPLVGGHPDYFCSQSKDEAGVSNLNKVLDAIWQWIRPAAPT